MDVVYHEIGEAGPETVTVEVDLTSPRIVCPRHGEAFRAQWPIGFMPFSVAVFEALVSDEVFANDVGESTAAIEGALDQRPICERINKTALLRAYVDSGIGAEGHCDNCQTDALGTPYSFSNPSGKVEVGHLCFQCLVYHLRWLH
jgi:hypothetical protein